MTEVVYKGFVCNNYLHYYFMINYKIKKCVSKAF